MGNKASAIHSSRVTKKAKKRNNLRGMFNYPNGRNIREQYNSTRANQWVTVFFNWADHKYNDEELMDLVVARINARDGIISSEPVHHDVKWCLSLRVPEYWNPSDVSITAAAKVIAKWHQSEMRNAGLWILAYSAIAFTINHAIIMLMLNGFRRVLVSQVPVVEQPGHERERWLYINGIAAGDHWVQMNIDQLSYIFGRKVTGVHNRTAGIVFDLIECLIQRDFSYATDDIRQSYALVKEALLDPECDKVVLLLHSQGGIEGGLVVDWLLDELPHDILHNLEVYTFGNAANHFNNPRWTKPASPRRISTPDLVHQSGQTIGYIEHYANAADIVALGGVLHFVDIPNRYMGRLFVRPNSGHLLNMHYLSNMFTLGPDMKVLDSNPFMDMEVEPWATAGINGHTGPPHRVRYQPTIARDEAFLPAELSLQQSQPNGVDRVLRVKDFSRLWQYRNGGCPKETEARHNSDTREHGYF
ncbi:hypothetical protein PEXP_071420 [Penicillium expansum]|nr:hypothetical protein PEXP_071420 [Penicillium expansum]